MYTMTVILFGVIAALFLGGYFHQRIRAARARRRERLSQREALAEAEWFARYFPRGLDQQEALTEILNALGRHLGVAWTCLRPDDSFAGSLAVEKIAFAGEELLEFESFLEEWLEKQGIAPGDVRVLDPLGPFLAHLDDVLSQRETGLRESAETRDSPCS